MDIIDQIIKRRDELCFSNAELGRRCGVTGQMISMVVHRRTPLGDDLADRIADALICDLVRDVRLVPRQTMRWYDGRNPPSSSSQSAPARASSTR